jgi:hypothetical protein
LHADNLAVLIEKEPTLGATPSYASVVRFMKVHGLIKRPRRGPVHSPGAQATEHRIETREIRSYESQYVNALWHLDFHHGSLRVLLDKRVLGTSARKPPLSDTLLWATLGLAHSFKIEVILSKRVDVLPKQRGREAQNIVLDHLALSAELADYIPDVQRIPSNDSAMSFVRIGTRWSRSSL